MNTNEINKNRVVVDDGIEEVNIVNRLGHTIGTFCFAPTDTDIIERYNKSVDKIEALVSRLSNVQLPELSADDEQADGSELKEIKAFNPFEEGKKELFEILDYLFAGNTSTAFFEHTSPFTLVNGRLYLEVVMDAIGAYIAQRFDSEIKKLSTHANKYVHGYRTGKHKNGGRRK